MKTIKELIKDGWEDADVSYAQYKVYVKGDKRLVYDDNKGEVIMEYNKIRYVEINNRKKI